jgi:hypothetical protein
MSVVVVSLGIVHFMLGVALSANIRTPFIAEIAQTLIAICVKLGRSMFLKANTVYEVRLPSLRLY